MQGGNFWQCPHCGTRNKGFAAVCLGCSRERRSGAAAERSRAPERVRLTRGARWALAVAFATAGILGFLLVRTFRSPALEAADVPLAEEAVDAGRDEVPTQATMPGAPDSGWMATADSGPAAGGVAPPQAVAPSAAIPQDAQAPTGSVLSYAPAAPRPAVARGRTYTDADLRAMAAARGTAATRDRGYILALRQRRVDDLSARLAAARSAEEQAKLRAWLDGAVRDLERAQRE